MKDYDIAKEFINDVFELHKIKMLKDSKMELVGNTFYPFYEKRGSTEKKPEINFTILFLYIPFIIVYIFVKDNLITMLSIPSAIIILSIILYIYSIKKWQIANNEYVFIVEQNKPKYAYLQNKIHMAIDKLNQYFPFTILLYNKIMNNDNISKDDALTFLIEHKNKKNSKSEYIKCEYCDAYTILTENKTFKCCNCGSNLKLW